MPKTAEEQTVLEDAVGRAIEAGEMSEAWPRNTIWLGGRRSSDHWEWNDGEMADRMDWAESQPSGTENPQEEPYLCLVADGTVHDSSAGSPPHASGAMGQGSADDEASEGPLWKVDPFPVPPVEEPLEGPLLKVDPFPAPPVGYGWETACLAGNDVVDDGWEHVFNEGRGTRDAACSESADCRRCKRRASSKGRTSSTSAADDFWQQVLAK